MFLDDDLRLITWVNYVCVFLLLLLNFTMWPATGNTYISK